MTHQVMKYMLKKLGIDAFGNLTHLKLKILIREVGKGVDGDLAYQVKTYMFKQFDIDADGNLTHPMLKALIKKVGKGVDGDLTYQVMKYTFKKFGVDDDDKETEFGNYDEKKGYPIRSPTQIPDPNTVDGPKHRSC